MEYPKINTLFKRDEKNKIILDQLTELEFEYLYNNKWECTEKIDGTNIRISRKLGLNTGKYEIAYQGRTNKAEIPSHLLEVLQELVTLTKINSVFPIDKEDYDQEIILYGEGYGQKIQKGHNYISGGVNFILFDIKVGRWWLKREALEDIARKLSLDIVPIIGYMTIPEAIEFVKTGFKSTIAQNSEYDAEGLVLKTPCGLLGRNGKRLITKLKTKDFRQL